MRDTLNIAAAVSIIVGIAGVGVTFPKEPSATDVAKLAALSAECATSQTMAGRSSSNSNSCARVTALQQSQDRTPQEWVTPATIAFNTAGFALVFLALANLQPARKTRAEASP